MTGTAINIQAHGLERLCDRLNGLVGMDTAELLDSFGGKVVEQTAERIEETKASPDGTPWAELSPEYAARKAEERGSNVGLLEYEGDLVESITFEASGSQVEVGSHLEYAAIQQFGGAEVGKNIPARSFLGLSGDNKDDLLAMLDSWMDEQLEIA